MASKKYLDYNGLDYFWGKIKDELDTKASIEYLPTPNWDENDSTSSEYIANRTHYKTSLGYVYPVDLAPIINANSFTYYEFGYTVGGNSYHYQTDLWLFTPDIDMPFIEDVNFNAESAQIKINGVNSTLNVNHELESNYIEFYNADLAFILYPGSEYTEASLWLADQDYLTNIESAFINVPSVNEFFKYKTFDNNYLNGKLITSGRGKYSEIFNNEEYNLADGINSHAENGRSSYESTAYLDLNGEANAVSYTFSISQSRAFYLRLQKHLQTIPEGFGVVLDSTGEFIRILGGFVTEVSTTHIKFIKTDSIDMSGEIMLEKTLDPVNAVSNHSYQILMYNTIANGEASHAEGLCSLADGYNSHAENSSIAKGSSAHSEGAGIAVGMESHAEQRSIASGERSHSEGYGVASGMVSHAEGSGVAYGRYSHAEGGVFANGTFVISLTGEANATTYTINGMRSNIENNGSLYTLPDGFPNLSGHTVGGVPITGQTITSNNVTSITLAKTLSSSAISNTEYVVDNVTTTSGYSSHAEGAFTISNGHYSHTEGRISASLGASSHSEGTLTRADSENSHAEGLGTIASSINQHVQGRWNVRDSSNAYAHIVGNGDISSRSNAYTLDWNGNGWYAGKLTVGSAPTNNMDVATKQYVDNATSSIPTAMSNLSDVAITNPSNGQVLTYSSGDWVNADLPSDAVVVTITSTTVDDVTTYSADKTYSELRSAHVSGKTVVLRYNNMVWHTHMAPNNITGTTPFYFGTLTGGASYYWIIRSSNEVERPTLRTVTSVNGQTGAVTLKTSDLTNDSGFITTNTTYSLSMSGNVITLTGSDSSTSSVTLPVYNGSVTTS